VSRRGSMRFIFLIFIALHGMAFDYQENIEYKRFQNIHLNKISDIENELKKLKTSPKENAELITSLKKERQEYIHIFLNSVINDKSIKDTILIDDENIISLKLKKDEALSAKDYITETRYDIQIHSDRLDSSFYELIKNATNAMYEYKVDDTLKNIFLKFQDTLTINVRVYDRVYHDILVSNSGATKTQAELEYLAAYYRLKDQFKVYSVIFHYMQEYVEKVSSTETLIRFFHIGQLVEMINKEFAFTTYDTFSMKNIGVKFGVLVTIGLIIISLWITYFLILKALHVMLLYRFSDDQERCKKAQNFLLSGISIPLKFILFIFAIDLSQRIIFFSDDNLDAIYYFDVIYALLYLWMFFRLIDGYVSHYADSFLKKYPSFRAEVINFFIIIIKFLLIISAIIVILHNMGINIFGIVASLGIGGIAIALAAKESLSNIFGSISIILDNMFSQGDWIVTPKGQGTVVEIGLRSTKVRTFDNAMTYYPNAYLASVEVKNFNKRKLGRRIKMHVGVEYRSNMQDVLKAVDDIRHMLIEHEGIADDNTHFDSSDMGANTRITKLEDQYGISKTLLVYLDSYGESSINILVYCFSKTVNWAEWLEVKQDVLYKISQILEQNQLTFAFPSSTLYLSNDDKAPLQVSLSE
jgi:MscS family membrane protein